LKEFRQKEEKGNEIRELEDIKFFTESSNCPRKCPMAKGVHCVFSKIGAVVNELVEYRLK